MRHIASIFIIALLGISLSFAQKDYSVGSFSVVKATAGVNVVLRKAYNPSVEVPQGLPVEIYTEGNTLVISMKKGNHQFKEKKTVVVNYTRLKGIQVNGGANIATEGTLNQPSLALYANGGGNIHCVLNVEEAAAEANGGGNIHLEGRTDEFVVQTVGGGNIDGKQLAASNVTATAQSGGNIIVLAKNSILANAESGGNIQYLGSPSSVSVNKSKGGRVVGAKSSTSSSSSSKGKGRAY